MFMYPVTLTPDKKDGGFVVTFTDIMDTTLTSYALMAEQDKRITETVLRERERLGNFIRRRVPNASEAEDIL